MSSRVTVSGASRTSQTSQRRHRSRSTSRYADLEKPKKKKTLTATTSLVSIPNTIKLSMLNSGLLSFERVKLEARDANNSLSQTIPDKPIELRHFVKLCEQRRKFPVLYKLEFQTAVKVETNTCRHATRKNNIEKNQNQKCIPYDYNRVVLDKMESTPDSDYVNASYVDSLLKPNAYIVTQGPTEETVTEFWRMVWQENVSAIIMLTKTFDFTKVMCVQYWPASKDKDESYGDIYIGIVKEEQLANFQIRTFRIYKKSGTTIVEERHILQFHYTEWHSHTCPFSNAVLEFRRRVRSVVGNIIKANSMVGPMLVHCNDGGGRSGVYLAIDANMELAEEEDCFHVFGYLKKLRQSRKGLIENVDQYKFVYDTLEEHIVCGKSWFPVKELSDKLKQKSQKDVVTKMNEYQKEYTQICKQTPRFSIGDCAGGHRADNREKNRDVLCVPPDNFRPYLTSFQGNAFTDYINAVFVDGYTKPREYIVTEWPVQKTLGEFWSLVYDQECSAVVVICSPPPNSQQYPAFWPEKRKASQKYGPVFTVTCKASKHYTNIRTWEFNINKKIVSLTELMAGVKAPMKACAFFQLTCWPMGHKVPTSTNSLVELMNMVEQWREKADYGPVCVVSPDGRSRAGVYCAANACIEQVIQHGEVDIFQAVKTVRRHRPQLVENITEYKYCYDLVLHYVLHYLNKDLKEKKFIEFGRGKVIPLTPENSNSDLPNEMSNTGRIVVKKRIAKIEKRESRDFTKLSDMATDRNGKLLERKKKGRLYSLGGNEPVKKGNRGRLDRLKTVGTFDLGAEMCILSEVARNLNEKIISGELSSSLENSANTGLSISTIPSISTTSCLSTPNGKKRNISKSSSGLTSKNGSQPDTKATGNVYFSPNEMTLFDNRKQSNCKNVISTVKTQYSAEDYRIKSMSDCSGGDNMKAVNRKCRSLSTSSYLSKDNSDFLVHNKTVRNNAKYSDTVLVHSEELITKLSPKIGKNVVNSSKISNYSLSKGKEMQARDFETDSNKIQEDIRSVEDVNKKYQMSGEKTFTSKTRKPILRKSKRIVRTDSEILSDDALAKNEIVLQAFYDIQVHKEQNFLEEDNCDAASSVPAKQSKHSSIESGLKSSKESSDFDDICSPRGILKSTDDSSRNISTDELDAVFSDSTELQQLEKDFREQVRSNLQREYKSDGDTLDEIGKKRNEFGKWKNQSFDNDLDFLQEDTSASAVIVGEKPSVNKKVDSIEFFEKISRNESVHDQNIIEPIKSNQPSMETSFAPVRPTKLNMRSIKTGKNSHESSRSSIFENPFGKFKKMNKLLKCKRFSSSALYEKKKQQEIKESNKSNKVFSASPAKGALSDSKSSIYSSKISLFATKNFIFSGKKSPMFSNSSLSNSELYSKSSSKAKLNELSKSNSEISKYRASPSRYSIKRSSNETKTNSTTCLPDESAISPLSEEFYNKTGSVRLSAMELFEKFCSEDFGGLYKHENFKNDERYDHIGHYHGRRDVSGAMKKIGMPRNARLLKQKSEPKFHLKSDFGPDEAHGGGVMYFHEEEDESQCYDEQDEFYEDYEGEYEDSYYGEEDEEEVEDEENVEDDEIEEYYPEDQQDDIGKIQLSEIQERNVGPVLYSIKSFDEMSDQDDDDIYCGQENNDMIAIDSEVDEIYLMPDESKCGNMDFCFSPKENLSKETCLARTDGFEKDLNILNDEDRKLKKGYNVDQDEILTIYRICSVDNIVAPKVEITTSRSQQFDARSQSSHYFNKEPDMPATQANDSNCNSLELAVDQYLKNTPIDSLEIISATDLSIIKSDCIERADSMELLSASSGTAHSSTLTDYAFDTVKNLHLDSCSTSKLSLSLKSEVFDEFTLTPDEPKRISDFEFEDFTLTPEDSFSENAQNDEMLDSKLMGITGNDNIRSSDSATNVLSIENDDTQGDVLTIVDQFLSQERAQQESFEDQNSKYKATLLNRKEGLKKGGSLTNETFHRAPMLKKLSNKFIFKSVNLSDDVFLYDKSDKINFGEMSSTSTDIVDDAKQEDIVSDFTTELTKEFDLLFFQAEQSIKRHEDEVISKHSDMNQESKMPTRHSMQKLEPYFIGEKETPAEGIVANVESANDKHENSETCSRRQIYSQLGKNKSQSLGNLNKKTRCFPL